MSFEAGLDAFAAKVRDVAERTVRKVATEVHTELIAHTPYGQPEFWKMPAPPGYIPGRARANWIPTVGFPSSENNRPPDKTGASAVALMAGLRIKLGDEVYLNNSVPYIEALEAGHSRQAPAGILAFGVQAGLAKARR